MKPLMGLIFQSSGPVSESLSTPISGPLHLSNAQILSVFASLRSAQICVQILNLYNNRMS